MTKEEIKDAVFNLSKEDIAEIAEYCRDLLSDIKQEEAQS